MRKILINMLKLDSTAVRAAQLREPSAEESFLGFAQKGDK